MIAEATPAKPRASVEERVEKLLKTVSASRLGTWHGCKMKFYFRYVLEIKKPPTPALHSGSVAHLVLQAWNKARWRGEAFNPALLRLLFDAQWTAAQTGQQIRWDGEEDKEREATWRALENYFAQTPIQSTDRPEAVEAKIEADLSSHGLPNLVGVLDLVRAGRRIVDFKITAKTPDSGMVAHMHSVQLSCYGVLYRDATGQEESGFELHHIVKTKTPKLVVTALAPIQERHQTRLFRAINSYADGLSRKDFVPSPGFGCAACDYFHECRAWD
jgi:putative RecB family exonuclease